MFSKLSDLVPHIDTAFEEFYQKMLTDKALSSFFENEAQIKSLIEKQKLFFTNALSLSAKEIEIQYINIGEFHYKINIPYIDYMKGLDILQESFVLYSQRTVESIELMEEIFLYFRFIKAKTAKGYLNMMLNEDLQDINLFFQNIDNVENKNNRDVVFDRINWLKSLIIHIQENQILDDELELEKDKFANWLEEIEIPHSNQKDFILNLHQRINQNTRNLFYFLERGDYLEILPLYSSLLNIYKLSLLLSNSVSITMSDNLIEGLNKDKLTNLYRKDNYLAFLTKEKEYIKRTRQQFSLISIDIDDFKHINDNYGHINGDKVLQRLGEVINNRIRSSDIGFRNGGDEFSILLKGAKKEQAFSIASKIKKDLLETRFKDKELGTFHIDLSIGIFECNENNLDLTIEEILTLLDKNLYKSKNDGKGTITY